MPWLALVGGLITLLSALSLWHWAHAVNNLASYVNTLCNDSDPAAGACAPVTSVSRLSIWVWLSLIVLLAEGVLYLLAFPGLKMRVKQGWNYLFYAGLVNLVYGLLSLFNGYNAAISFVVVLIGSVIGFWLLFQIRCAYVGVKSVTLNTSKTPTLHV